MRFHRQPRRDLFAEWDAYRIDMDSAWAAMVVSQSHTQNEVRRFVEFADPLAIESMHRAVYTDLQVVKDKVDEYERHVADVAQRNDLLVQARLLQGILEDVDILKSRVNQIGALVDRAVIRP